MGCLMTLNMGCFMTLNMGCLMTLNMGCLMPFSLIIERIGSSVLARRQTELNDQISVLPRKLQVDT